MALEDDLKKLTAAVEDLTAITKTLADLRANAIETVKATAAPAAKATKGAAEPKAAAAEPAAAEPAAAAPVDAAAAAEPAAAAPDAKVYEAMTALVSEYVAGGSTEDERTARKAKVKSLFQHEAVKKPGTPADVFDTKNVKDEMIPAFIEKMKTWIGEGDLIKPAATSALDL